MAPREHGGSPVRQRVQPGSLKGSSPSLGWFCNDWEGHVLGCLTEYLSVAPRCLEQKKPLWVVCLAQANTGSGPGGQGRQVQDRVPEFPSVWEDKGASVAER